MRRFIGPIIIVLVSITLVLVWFKSGLLIAGGENGPLLMRPDRLFDSIRYLWSANEGTGTLLPHYFATIPFYYVASFLFKNGLSAVNIQRILFGLLLLTGGLSMYFLTTMVLKSSHQDNNHNLPITNYQLPALLAGLFYMLNPYAMAMVWHRFIYPTMFLYASLPLVLLLFIKGLNEKKIFYALAISVVSFVFSFTYSHPAFIIVFWLPPSTYALFYLYLNRHSQKNMLYVTKFFGATLVLWLLTSIWWLLPFSKLISAVGSYYTSETARTSVMSHRYHSPYYLTRLLNPFYFFDVKSWGAIYSSFVFWVVSWITPIAVLIGVVLNIRSRFTQYFALLSVFGLFLAKGANPPLGEPMRILFEIFPAMVAFRDFFGRFGIILPLGYAFLFGLGFSSIFYKIKNSPRLDKTNSDRLKVILRTLARVSTGTLLLLGLVVYPWPMWTGSVFNSPRGDARIKIPSYYVAADTWFNKQKGDSRLFHLPLVIGGVTFDWKPNKYQGYDPSRVLFEKSSISGHIRVREFDKLLTRIDKSLNTQQLWKIMTIFNARYVVLRRDIDIGNTNKTKTSAHSPNEIQEILKHIEKLNLYEQVEFMPMLPTKEPEAMGWELVWGNSKNTTAKWDPYERATSACYALTIRGSSGGEYMGWAYNLAQSSQNWRGATFLTITLKSSIPSKTLQFSISDKNGNTLTWDGRADSEYSIASYETSKWKCFVLTLDKPTSPPPKNFEFSKVKRIFIVSKTADPRKKIILKIGSIALAPSSKVKNEGIHHVKTFGKLDIYELNKKYFLEHIYATNQYIHTRDFRTLFEEVEKDSFVPGNQIILLKSQAEITKVKSAEVLYQPKITYDKINPAKYNVRVKNATKPYFLVFSETYDPGWKAYVDGKEAKKHFIANGYANAYHINQKGTYNIELKFAPAQLLGLGALVSLISFVVASLLVIITATLSNKNGGPKK